MKNFYSIWILCTSILLLELLPPDLFAQAGNLDSTFSYDGIAGLNFGLGDSKSQSIAVQGDGKSVVAGFHENGSYYDFALARYKTDGTLDSTFSSDGLSTTDFYGQDDKAFGVVIQSDGKIVAAGYTYHTSYSQLVFAIARYNTDGTPDATFGGSGKAYAYFGSGDQTGYSLAIQADGKIVVVGIGTFDPMPTDNYFCVARFSTSGSLDPTFSSNGLATYLPSGTGYDSYAFDVEIQNNQKILVGGTITSATGSKMTVLRLNSDGAYDNTFDANGIVTTAINNISASGNKICLQSDQKILVVGGSNNDMAVMRFNTNGSIDSTFDADGYVLIDFGSTSNNGYAIALEPDGKIVPGGITYVGTGDYDFALARLNTDGSYDLSFGGDGKITVPILNGEEWLTDVATQSDGKILATGYYNPNSGNFLTVRILSCSTTGSVQNASDCLQYYWAENQQTYTATGTYYVTYPNAAGCDSIITLNLTIYQNPNVNVTQNGSTLTAVQSGATYQWLDCNSNNDPVPGATYQSYTATTNGSYRVQVTKNGCTDFSNCTTITSVGIDEIISDPISHISISPNPTASLIHIYPGNSLNRIIVMDMSGREILSEENNSSKEISIDLSSLNNGIYFVQMIKGDTTIGVQKVFKY